MHYVYVLICKNGSFYTGITLNLKNRFNLHQSGKVLSTRWRVPVKLVFFSVVPNKFIAANLEKFLKSKSGRIFVKKYILPKKLAKQTRQVYLA